METIFYQCIGWFLRRFVRLIGRSIYRITVFQTKNIPQKGGALIVANHTSYMDFVLIACSVPRKTSFIMNADVFKKPGLRWLLKGLECIPISPRGGKNNFDEFNQTVKEKIDAGKIVVIFAEGTVTRTGQMLEFKKGIEHLSAIITAPIIPIHFHNVQGTPFTFRGGKSSIEKFSLKNLRREILVIIGNPLYGKISAFSLRQKIKEMEVENFETYLSRSKPIHQLIKDSLTRSSQGAWISSTNEIRFSDLDQRLRKMNKVLRPLLSEVERVALLLPKDPNSLLIQLWLLQNNKIIIQIDPKFNNEEQFFVLNKAKVSTLITTSNSEFSRLSPTAQNIIFTEDIFKELNEGKSHNTFIKPIANIQNNITSAFIHPNSLDEIVTIVFEKKANDEIHCISLSNRNLLAVLQGIKQVYFFDKGSHLLSNLPLHHSYGFVIEFLLPLLFDLQLDMPGNEVTAEEFIQRLIETKPKTVIATPRQLRLIAELSQLKNIPFLTHIFTADLHPDHQTIHQLNSRGIQVFVGAGMNSTASVFALNLHNYTGKDVVGKIFEQENSDPESIGKPIPGVAVKICDDNMQELESEETGTLWIKGPCISYENTQEITCKPDLVDGWLKTNMLGNINQRGFIHILTHDATQPIEKNLS